MVGKRELHERMWPDSFVSDASLGGAREGAPRALDDRNPVTPMIRTTHRIGYALCLDVNVLEPLPARASHWL